MQPHHHGLTGNIGSGKSTVARQFERLGIPVYYADARAKALMTEDEELRLGIVAEFGPESYTADGRLNRPHLATAFAEPARLAALNALVHPAVARDGARWRAAQTAPYTLHEAAILLEIGVASSYESMIVVTAPEAVRRQRVLRRDSHLTAADFAERAARQWSEDRKVAAADYVVYNNGHRLLLPQVLRLHRQLAAYATDL